jgi:hypothetical protein
MDTEKASGIWRMFDNDCVSVLQAWAYSGIQIKSSRLPQLNPNPKSKCTLRLHVQLKCNHESSLCAVGLYLAVCVVDARMQQLSTGNEGSLETSWGDVDPWWEVSPTGRKIGGEIVHTARSSLLSSTQPLGKGMI